MQTYQVVGRHQRQRGTTLLEALIAFLVLSLGMLAIARLQTQLRSSSDVARQRSEAVRIAQHDLESMRDFSVLAGTSGSRSYEGIDSLERSVDAVDGTANYRIARRIGTTGMPGAKTISVVVAWSDRSGTAQQVELGSIIAAADPAYSGALGLARGVSTVNKPYARSLQVPLNAKDLGNGSSAFKPVSDGTAAFVFDNRSGAVIAHCRSVGANTATRDLTIGSLGSCDTVNGLLLGGVVRFTSASPPDAGAANDVPLATTLSLTLSVGGSASAPVCTSEALKTVSFMEGGSRHVDAVPMDATVASFGLGGWEDTGERHLAYHCVVLVPPGGAWSGGVTLLPGDWRIGTLGTDRRVCRYSVDLDASGAIDANIEHPAIYVDVKAALMNQNFLVINGDEICPGAAPARSAAGSTDVFADLATIQHQP